MDFFVLEGAPPGADTTPGMQIQPVTTLPGWVIVAAAIVAGIFIFDELLSSSK